MICGTDLCSLLPLDRKIAVHKDIKGFYGTQQPGPRESIKPETRNITKNEDDGQQKPKKLQIISFDEIVIIISLSERYNSHCLIR